MRRTKILTLFSITVLFILLSSIFIPNISSSGNENKFITKSFENFATPGLKIYKEEKCCNGYTLCGIIPISFGIDILNDILDLESKALLIDMNANIIKKWDVNPHPAIMLPSGSIITGFGEHESSWEMRNLTQFDWEGNIEWNFNNWSIDENGDNIARQHHDFQREGNPVGYYAPGQDFKENGNTLILAHNSTYNSSITFKKIIYDDVIYEVDWEGNLTDFVWLASEHIDELGLSLISRIGMWLRPGGPGYGLFCPTGDLLHINTATYLGENKWYDLGHEEFNPNNILICSRHTNILAIIDRETGKIVWRVGPDYSKKLFDNKLDQIMGPHQAHIIPKGLPGEGNILVFDNGGQSDYSLLGTPRYNRGYSRIVEFDPLTLEIVWEYKHIAGKTFLSGELHKFYTAIMGSVQRLPNGNTLVSEGISKRIFEITPDKELVWEYFCENNFKIYRAYRIPPEWIPENPSDYCLWENS